MSTLFKKLLSVEVWSGTVDSLSKTKDLQDYSEVPQLLKKISELVNNVPQAEAFVEVSEVLIPYAKLVGIVLSAIQKRDDPRDYPECVSVAFLIAFLKNIIKFSEGLGLESTRVERISKTIHEVGMTLTEVKEAWYSFPESTLAYVFSERISLLLESSGVPRNQHIWLVERAKWKTRDTIFSIWGEMPDRARIYQTLSIAEETKESKPIQDLERYLNEFENKEFLSTEVSSIPLKKLYVPLRLQETDIEGKTTTGNAENVNEWISRFLLEEENDRILFVQGESGQGKTTFCRMLFDYVKTNIHPAYSPVFIPLCKIKIKNIEYGLKETLNKHLDDVRFFLNNSDWLAEGDRRFLILLDGFDELPIESGENVIEFIEQVTKFQKGQHQFILTGRHLPVGNLKLAFEDVSICWTRLLPMSIEERSHWIKKWSGETLLGQENKELKGNIFASCYEIVEEAFENRTMLFVLAVIGMVSEKEIYSGVEEEIEGRQDFIAKEILTQHIDKAIDSLSDQYLFEEFLENPDLSLPLPPISLIKAIVVGILSIVQPSISPFTLLENSLQKINYFVSYRMVSLNAYFLENLNVAPRLLNINEDRYEKRALNHIEIEKLRQFKDQFSKLIESILRSRFCLPVKEIEKYLTKNQYDESLLRSCNIRQLGKVCYLLILKNSKSNEFNLFLRHACPSDIADDFSREPILLSLLATLYFDAKNDIKQHLVGKNIVQSKVIIYQALLERSFFRMRKTPKGKGLKKRLDMEKDAEKLFLEKVLSELALCIAQSQTELYNLESFLTQLNSKSFDEKDLVVKLQSSFRERPYFKDLVVDILSNYYARPIRNKKNVLIKFIHKSFYEFLYAKRILDELRQWTALMLADDSNIDQSFQQEKVYNILGYGLVSREILKYFGVLITDIEEAELVEIFVCLDAFYTRWNDGLYSNYNDHAKAPWLELQERQMRTKLNLSTKHLDVYTGVNVIILLLGLQRYCQNSLTLSEDVLFSPCHEDDADTSGKRYSILRTVGYCQSLKVANFDQPSSNFFATTVGGFLEGIDLVNAELAGVDLRRVNFKKAKLQFAKMMRTNLYDADLEDADLSGADLSFSDLRCKNIKNANFRGAILDGANLENIDFREATIDDQYADNFSAISLVNANLSGASIRGVNLSSSILDGLDLTRLDLRDTDLSDAYLRGCNLQGMDLNLLESVEGADFTGSNLTDAALAGVNLSNCTMNGLDLRGFDLRGVNFSSANLRGCNLQGMDLNLLKSVKGADFTGADLRNAVFGGVDLSGCTLDGLDLRSFDDLTDVKLSYTILGGCNLEGIDLSVLKFVEGVDFTEANLTDVILAGMELRNCTFNGLNFNDFELINTDLNGSKLLNCNFAGKDFNLLSSVEGADFTSAILTESTLRGVNLSHCIFSDLDSSQFDLAGANLDGAEFWNCSFKGMDFNELHLIETGITFRESDLTNVAMQGPNLYRYILKECGFSHSNLDTLNISDSKFDNSTIEEVSFRRVNLTSVSFLGSKLCKIDFSDSILQQVDFSDSILQQVDFSGVDLSDCNVTADTRFIEVKGNDHTHWPVCTLENRDK